MNVTPGTVYLVGAGPGDPGLITVRGLAFLRRADVVVHDRLIPRELLREVRPDARLIDVGKTPDRLGVTQEQINAILIEEAQTGHTVVRLKGGDPFVFGRGFEELAACRAAGIRCVVIPGVTSAIAAAAAAGIPVTHRGTSQSVAIVTARTGDDADSPIHNFAALAETDTLVVLMGRAGLREFTESLMAAGKALTTPAACIERGTTPRQRVVRATLETLADAADRDGLKPPVVTVIGDVAALRADDLEGAFPAAFVEDDPLAGKRIVVTRADSSSSRLVALLRDEGATVIECPLIRIVYPRRQEAFVAALAHIDKCHWIVLTSIHAVRALGRALREANLDTRALASCKIAAIGPATARALQQIGLMPDLIPNDHTAGALAVTLGPLVDGKRVLLPRSDIASSELPRRLRDFGATVDEVVAYHTRPAEPSTVATTAIREGVDAVVFCSPSAVRRFIELGLDANGATVACIGPTTAQAARDAGLSVDVIARPHTSTGIVTALNDHFSQVGAHS